jgi:hypothetical protein
MAISLTDKAARDVSALGYPAVFPAGSIIELYDTAQVAGSAPAGTKIATGTLPASPWGVQASRSVPKSGVWQMTGVAGAGAGTDALGYRLKTAGDTNAATQGEARVVGSVGEAGSGADMILDNSNVANAQVVTVNSFTLGIA